MITAVQSQSLSTTLRPRAAANAAPAQEPPQFPNDEVAAFGKVDTPQEAAQLPILDPTFQFGLIMGLAATMDPSQSLSVSLQSKSQSGQVAIDQGTNLHKPDEQGSVGSGGGLVGQTYFEGNNLTMTPDGKLQFTSRFGETDTNLTLGKGPNGNVLAGKIGDVDADLSLNLVMDGTGLHITTSGTLGGLPYELKTDAGQDSWTSQGHLGDQEISKTYATRQEPGPDGAKVIFEGHGTNAGMDQSVNFEMRVSKQA